MYVNPGWETADKVVPLGFFKLLYRSLRRVLALERINLAQGFALGAAIREDDGTNLSVQAAAEKHYNEAYPPEDEWGSEETEPE